MNKISTTVATRKKANRNNQIDTIHRQIDESNFLRYITFADVTIRYTDTILRNELSWLKTAALLFIITRGGSLTPSQLANIMLRSNFSITKLIDGLSREGLVSRRRDTRDRRALRLSVTPQGITFIESSLTLLARGEELINSCLTETERKTLSNLTRKLRLNLIEQITGLKS